MLVAVHRQVALTILLLNESFAAEITLPRTVSSVQKRVSFQAILRAEDFCAFGTREILLLDD